MSKQLWDSTSKFYQRFHVEDTSIFKRQRVFMEEVLEFLQVSSLWVGQEAIEDTWFFDQNKESLQENLVEEAVDVIVTVMGVLMAHGIEHHELEQAMAEVAQKNDAKTDATHYKDGAGKISRRPKLEYKAYLDVFQKRWPISEVNWPASKDTWDAYTLAVQTELMDGLR